MIRTQQAGFVIVGMFLCSLLIGSTVGAGTSRPLERPELSTQSQSHRVEGHLERGLALQAIGNFDAAVAEFLKILEIDPRHPDAFYHLSIARRLARDREETRLAIADPSKAAAELSQALVKDGQQFMMNGNLVGGVERFRRAVLMDPSNPKTRLGLVSALFAIGNVESALKEVRVVLNVHQDLAQAHWQLGRILMVKQQWLAAQKVLEDALRLNPDMAHVHYALGTLRYTLGDIPGAMVSYRRSLSLNPHFPDAHYQLGLMLKVSGNDKNAVEEFVHAAESGIPPAQFFLGMAYRHGVGVDPDLTLALRWWFRAAESGHAQARHALADLRRSVLATRPSSNTSRSKYSTTIRNSKRCSISQKTPNDAAGCSKWPSSKAAGSEKAEAYRDDTLRPSSNENAAGGHFQHPAGPQELLSAFEQYRQRLWEDFPELVQDDSSQTVGAKLLQVGRAKEAVPILIREASAFGHHSHHLLEILYEEGVEGQLPPLDSKILTYLKSPAGEAVLGPAPPDFNDVSHQQVQAGQVPPIQETGFP